ncbi:MAG: thioredoxin family protein [Pseudomonadota bacterium]|nr:thioredoxin family protein [Pseudomonadota bacterium]
MHVMLKRLLGAVILLLLTQNPAAGAAEPRPVVIHFFWGEGCPHCAAERPFLEALAGRSPGVELRAYEVWRQKDHRPLFRELAAAYGVTGGSVPTTFVGDRVWVGFTEQIKAQIEAEVNACRARGCADPLTRVQRAADRPAAAGGTIRVPGLGEIDLAARSLVFTTLVIALVDGFNPCSLWVLALLLAVVIHSGSRQKVLAVGLTFLLIAAGVYGLFLAGLVNVLAYVGYLGWIQALLALLALGFALINIKDYFWFKRGVSLTIAERHKPGIYQSIRRIMAPGQSPAALLGATAAMAAGVTLIELPCTVGFPVVWSTLLARHDPDTGAFLALLGLYLLVFLLDELMVFLVAVVTLKATRLEERHGRVLKLVGGMVMLALAVVLLVAPEWMNDPGGSLLVFGAALLAALLILFIDRAIRPRLGMPQRR